MAVKAVHLEAVSDLTSETFISALKRLISRRGKPSQILSDNGTNFVGANNHLKVYTFLAAKATQDQVMKFTTSQKIKWSFIPEHSPHFGGIWEAAVKSAKFHLSVFQVITSSRLKSLAQSVRLRLFLTADHLFLSSLLILRVLIV